MQLPEGIVRGLRIWSPSEEAESDGMRFFNIEEASPRWYEAPCAVTELCGKRDLLAEIPRALS